LIDKKDNVPEKDEYVKKKIRQLLDKLSRYHQKLFIFLFFVVIASVFWYIRSLGEEYEAVVDYPVRYTNFPEGKVLVGEMPDKLTLTIQSTGFNILKSKLNLNLIPLRFDVNSFSLRSIGIDTFYILTETVHDILSEELSQVQILDISPDTLFFRFNELHVRKIAVMPQLDMNERFFHLQYMQNGDIEVIPDSIIVSGPSGLLDAMGVVYTEPLKLTGLSDTTEVTAELLKADQLSYSQQKVKVIIPVDQFTEVDENLPVSSVNVPDSLQIIPMPGQVRITYRICLSNYNKIRNNPLDLCIDYDKAVREQTRRLSVFLSDTPAYISNIRLNPKEIEYLIRRK